MRRHALLDDSSNWTKADCVRIIAEFFHDVANDGFPEVYVGPGAKDSTLIPDIRLEELREALIVYDNECWYGAIG